ncbi:MAG: GspH/FimT family pseudopilin [Opitutae bacterium]|nr:GspH/FimT family pseudopilin [Opitutae bacterium]
MTSPTAQIPPVESGPRSRRAFTLIELILVMALLAIAAGLAAPRMASFFRGRTLDQEVRRLHALANYAQSRAVAEGMPVVLWLDARAGTYGQMIQTGFVDFDERATTFTVDATLALETTAAEPTQAYEPVDETPNLPEGQAMIRFSPEGYVDEISVPKVTLRQGTEMVREVALTANGLGYEILPAHAP